MRSGTRDAVFHGKLEKMKESLSWIDNHASRKQKQQVEEALHSSTSMNLSIADVSTKEVDDMIRVSHESSVISTPLTEKDLNYVSREDRPELLDEEIRNRKKIINGLKYEIRELEALKK